MENHQILVFDNYDSFTYNLVHLVEYLTGKPVTVFRNDQEPLDSVEPFSHIILSPGPGLPSEAGLMIPLIKRFAPTKKILGVCLGHQAIAEAFGGTLHNLDNVYHGVSTPIQVEPSWVDKDIFKDMGNPVEVGRYHSWVVNKQGLPPELQVTAYDAGGFIMAMAHTAFNLRSVQFHPESVLTPLGETLMRNWLQL